MRPAVTVIVTSDYAVDTVQNDENLRQCLAALSCQDVDEPVEFVVVESSALDAAFAAELRQILPSLRIIAGEGSSAAALKNAGARAASADLVAFIDADCVAERGWLRYFLATMRAHPEIAAVSGRTHYGAGHFIDRAMALLSRSYLDRERAGYTRHVAINNAGFRRSVFLSYPCPMESGAHMSLLQSEALRRAGHQFFFHPQLSVQHAYDGWPAEREIRRSLGYGVIRARQIDGRVPYASFARLGYLSIPIFAALRALRGCWNCIRRRRPYGVAWYELPAVFALAAIASAMEIPGMIRAVRHKPLEKTLFR